MSENSASDSWCLSIDDQKRPSSRSSKHDSATHLRSSWPRACMSCSRLHVTVSAPNRTELGYFGPGSMTWRVDRELAVLLGSGSRALMLQVAHPKVAAAVADHSRYRSDPLGRLRDTLNAIYGFAFGDVATVDGIVEHIHHLHTRVRGATPDGDPYSALDPHLLL